LFPGANVNAQKSNGWTPIHWAAQNNHPGIVCLLLEKHADVNVPATFDEHKDCLAIHQAAQHGHTPILKMLIVAGAKVGLESRFMTDNKF
jgi:ankyrin repeat protein